MGSWWATPEEAFKDFQARSEKLCAWDEAIRKPSHYSSKSFTAEKRAERLYSKLLLELPRAFELIKEVKPLTDLELVEYQRKGAHYLAHLKDIRALLE